MAGDHQPKEFGAVRCGGPLGQPGGGAGDVNRAGGNQGGRHYRVVVEPLPRLSRLDGRLSPTGDVRTLPVTVSTEKINEGTEDGNGRFLRTASRMCGEACYSSSTTMAGLSRCTINLPNYLQAANG